MEKLITNADIKQAERDFWDAIIKQRRTIKKNQEVKSEY